MRQAGTLDNETEAHRFIDHLLVLDIAASADQDDDRWIIWIRDESHLEQAKTELARFRANPQADDYKNVAKQAEAKRMQEVDARREAARNTVHMQQHWQRPLTKRAPLVVLMIGLSVVVALLSKMGGDIQGDVIGSLLITKPIVVPGGINWPNDLLAAVKQGQVWRVVTPIFIHFGIMHIVFNMYWLHLLGAQIEERRGTWRFGVMVLVIAIGSNLGQLLMAAQPNPLFGGMSGVVYGLFGYIWFKSLYDPKAGFSIAQSTVLIMLGWLVLCFTGVMDSGGSGVANVAHAMGLALGCMIAYLPLLAKR